MAWVHSRSEIFGSSLSAESLSNTTWNWTCNLIFQRLQHWSWCYHNPCKQVWGKFHVIHYKHPSSHHPASACLWMDCILPVLINKTPGHMNSIAQSKDSVDTEGAFCLFLLRTMALGRGDDSSRSLCTKLNTAPVHAEGRGLNATKPDYLQNANIRFNSK